MNINELLSELLQFSKEREWFEFKENWFEPIALGEYVSALSNAAALVGKEFAYFVWGVSDKEHSLVGTDFDQYQDYKNEPYINFLNRNLNPRVKIDFFEDNIPESELEHMGYTKSSILSHIDFNGTISYFFNKGALVKIDYTLMEADCFSNHVNKYSAEDFISYVKENVPYLFCDNNIEESDENVECFL